MIYALIDVFEPLTWHVYRALRRDTMHERQFGRCLVYGSAPALQKASEAERFLKDSDPEVWGHISSAAFTLIEEGPEGGYRRHPNKRFAFSRSLVGARAEDFACTWVGYYFWSLEIDGWSWRDRIFVRPSAHQSVLQTKAWMAKIGYEGPVSDILDEYLSETEANKLVDPTPGNAPRNSGGPSED